MPNSHHEPDGWRWAVAVLILGNIASGLSIGAILLERFVPAYEGGRFTRAGWAMVVAYASVVACAGAAAVVLGLRVRRRYDTPGQARTRKFAEIGMGVAIATLVMAMWPFGWVVHKRWNAPIPERWEMDMTTGPRFWAESTGAKRWELTRALAFEGHAEAFALLLEAGASPDPQVRLEVAEQFFTILVNKRRLADPTGAARVIHALLLDPGPRVREWALESMQRCVERGHIRFVTFAGPLMEVVSKTRPGAEEEGDIPAEAVERRAHAFRALLFMSNAATEEFWAEMQRLLDDPDCDDDLRRRCAELLDHIDSDQSDPFREEFAPEGR